MLVKYFPGCWSLASIQGQIQDFLGGGAPLRNSVTDWWPDVNTSCIRKPLVISGVGEGGGYAPLDPPLIFVSDNMYFLYSNLQSPWKNSFLFENIWTTGTASNPTTWRRQWLMFHSRWGSWRLSCDLLVRTRNSEFIKGYLLISLGTT